MDHLRSVLLSDEPDGSGPPLAVLYSRCHAVHMHQDLLAASKDAKIIDAAIALFTRNESAVEQLGLFSANEDRDDLATGDIKYLLLPFYRGSLLAAAPVRTDDSGGPSASRLAAVTRASGALGSFLQRCEQYDLVGGLGRMALAAASEGPIDPATKRTFKVEKFKREKALNAALGALEARRAASGAQEHEDGAVGGGRSTSAADAAAFALCRSGTAGAVGGGAVDEEDERQLWVWRVELAVLQALDLQAALKQEVELLQHAAVREAAAAAAGPGPSSSRRQEDSGPGEGERAQLMERLRAICVDLDGSRKEKIRSNVFKPGHILPTITVEEAGEMEMCETAEREAQQRRREEKERARWAALDSDEEDAEGKAKQRAWDDWRDAHPKGYGNSKLRPCS